MEERSALLLRWCLKLADGAEQKSRTKESAESPETVTRPFQDQQESEKCCHNAINDDKARWIRVGAGWTNKDGKGLNLVFDSYPVVGRICLREVPPADNAEQPDLMAGAR